MKKETLAERLNQAMDLSGMSQGALAKASGVAQPTIWRLTSGNARGSTKIVEIANALGGVKKALLLKPLAWICWHARPMAPCAMP